MNTHVKIGNAEYNIASMRSKTLEEALSTIANRIISPEDVKKAWKACNGFSIPNHLKDQLKGVKPNRENQRSEKKETKNKSKK